MNEIKKINVDGVDYDIVAKGLTKTTYTELKALRDNGQLSEGHLYRITDYVTTTTKSETKSAGNVFDVIVLAVSSNELSHIARAIQHEGDTYFDGNDLGAWELWYDLDNDTEKYEWADATNGKGVIYRMIDDKANDCPYDFKNILFYNPKYTNTTTEDNYYYTFSYVVSGKLYDGTVEKQVKNCYSNSMGVRIYSNKMTLLFNVFNCNTFGTNCSSNTFGTDCYKNTFRNNCTRNTLGNSCYHNTFGNSCYNNTLGNSCYNNTFGNNSCYSNTFGNNCCGNTFGNDCSSNTFGNSCFHNTFGTYCTMNTLGNSCYHNTFGNSCSDKTLGAGSLGYKVESSEEFYDDGSGQLVPIKHPDLSTQPSILPYKFMGQYVYEQLIPKSGLFIQTGVLSSIANKRNVIAVKEPIFLEAWYIGNNGALRQSEIEVHEGEFGDKEYHFMNPLSNIEYLRIVYTSMPEEGGYYGYNNY